MSPHKIMQIYESTICINMCHNTAEAIEYIKGEQVYVHPI